MTKTESKSSLTLGLSFFSNAKTGKSFHFLKCFRARVPQNLLHTILGCLDFDLHFKKKSNYSVTKKLLLKNEEKSKNNIV